MAGDVQPLVVPVRVEVEKSALAGLGDEVRRARDAGGVAGTAAAAAPASASSPDIVSVRAVLREFQRLEVASQALADLFERIAKMPVPAFSVPSTTAPLAQPAGQMPAGAPPAGGGGGGGGNRNWVRRPSDPASQFLYGAFGVAGLGLGVAAAFAEVAKMAASSRTFGEEAFIAASGGGGGVREGTDISRRLLAPPPFPLLATPQDSLRTLDQLRRRGSPITPEDARLVSEYGVRDFGSAQAGGAFAGQMFDMTRSERTVEHLGTLVRISHETGQTTSAVKEQLLDLTRAMTERQGVHRTTPQEDSDRANLISSLNLLPRGVGEGSGAMQIVQGVMAASQSGFGRMNLMSAFMRETGRGVSSPEDYFQFSLWSAKATNVLPAQVREAELGSGGDKGLFGVRLLELGVNPEAASAIRDAPPGAMRRRLVDKLAAREEAERVARERATESAGGEGAGSLENKSARQRAEAERTPVTALQEFVDYLISLNPTVAAGAEAAGGLGLSAVAKGALGAGAMSGTIALGRRLLRRGGGGVTAGAAGITRAGPSTMGLLKLLGPLFGAGELAKDAYDALAGGDPSNLGDMFSGGVGALVGGTAGLLTPVPGGMLGGGLTGYGLGKSLWQMLAGGGGGAPAAASAGTGSEGWQRPEVAEHLALLRQLVAADLRRRAAWDGGSTDPLGPLHFGGAKAEADFSTTWPAPISSRAASRLSPNDPRIAAAARAAHIPTALLLGIVKTESDFDPTARSEKGAMGLTQLMPGTARELGVKDPFDVNDNLVGGARYASQMIDRYPGNLPRALYAYNAGPGAADAGGEHAADRSDYDEKVIGIAKRAADSMRRADAREKELKATNDPEAQALRMREIEDSVLGPRDEGASSGAGHDLVVRLEPAPGLEDIIRPSRTVVPGARRRRPQ